MSPNSAEQDHLRAARLHEIAGAWQIVGPPFEPRGGWHFVVTEDRSFGWASTPDIDDASRASLCRRLDAAEGTDDAADQWRNFDLADGLMVVRCRRGQEIGRYWFRTAIRAGRMSAYPAPIELTAGAIVWTEVLPDPNRSAAHTSASPAPFPPRLISPQIRREYLLRRLPD